MHSGTQGARGHCQCSRLPPTGWHCSRRPPSHPAEGPLNTEYQGASSLIDAMVAASPQASAPQVRWEGYERPARAFTPRHGTCRGGAGLMRQGPGAEHAPSAGVGPSPSWNPQPLLLAAGGRLPRLPARPGPQPRWTYQLQVWGGGRAFRWQSGAGTNVCHMARLHAPYSAALLVAHAHPSHAPRPAPRLPAASSWRW